MAIEIKITGMNAESALADLRMLADLMLSPKVLQPLTPDEVMQKAADVRATMPDPEEPKAKRGRPKKEAEPANDEKPTMTAAQAEQWAQGDKTVEAEPLAVKPTRDDCMNAMRHVSEKFGYDHTRALLQKFDTPKLSLLPEEKYEAFIKAAYDWKAEVA